MRRFRAFSSNEATGSTLTLVMQSSPLSVATQTVWVCGAPLLPNGLID
jgi:hypothetical protein